MKHKHIGTNMRTKYALMLVALTTAALLVTTTPSQAMYRDGPNLYQYVRSNPTNLGDPTGLWRKDFHYGITLELAKKAGIACAADVAAGCNRPDEDERDAPTSFKAAAANIIAASYLDKQMLYNAADQLREEARQRLTQAAEWHFPADPNGLVTHNSDVANATVDKGIKDCDFKLFSEGLHTLQDSWSHQGKPFLEGLGHARGAEWVESHWERYGFLWLQERWVPGYWKKLDGLAAAWSTSADDVTIWPEDARAAASATYEKMLVFKARCRCACPGPQNTKVKTSAGDSKMDISAWLKQKFPGENKVK